jgi:hypothetical protein
MSRFLPGFEVFTTYKMGWAELRNGVLLRAAADHGIDVLLTIDKKMEFEQNLRNLPLPIVLLDAKSNTLPSLMPFLPHAISLFGTVLIPALYVIGRDGIVERLQAPRISDG